MIKTILYYSSLSFLAGIEISANTICLSLLGIFAITILGLLTYKFYLFKKRQAIIHKYEHTAATQSAASRKYEEVNIFKHTTTINRIGMVLALAFCFLAINYTTYTKEISYPPSIVHMPYEDAYFIEPPSTPTAPPPPPPAAPLLPPPPPPTNQFIATDVKIQEIITPIEPDPSSIHDPFATGDLTANPSTYNTLSNGQNTSNALIAPPPPLAIKEEKLPEIFEVVEQMPRFPGCEDMADDDNAKKACADQKMLQWIYAQIKYPNLAREMGIEGTAIIAFVVDQNGYIKNIDIIKKVGGGCEEEALRVIEQMAKLPQQWTPGKQRGRAVSVRYTLPIRFKLKS